MPVKKSTQANIMLLLVAAIWGASYPITRACVQNVNAYVFILGRFALATLVLAPLAMRAGLWDRQALRIGAILGVIEGLICAILTWNIRYMPASRCAFIVGTSVMMVPLWSAWLQGTALRLRHLIRAALSMVGLYFLTGARLGSLGLPELWVLIAASLWALNLVLLKRETSRCAVKPQVLAFYQTLCTCAVPIALLLYLPPVDYHFNGWALVGLGYCALFASAINLILQAKYQKHTTAAQASLRLSLEPLFACLVATAFFHEAADLSTVLGGSIMLLAAVLPEIQPWLESRRAAAVSRAASPDQASIGADWQGARSPPLNAHRAVSRRLPAALPKRRERGLGRDKTGQGHHPGTP